MDTKILERLVIITNNSFEDLQDVFKLLSENRVGKLTTNYFAVSTETNLNRQAISNFGLDKVQKFNTLQMKSKSEGYTTNIYSFSIKIPTETI